jgi:hypothetical protein
MSNKPSIIERFASPHSFRGVGYIILNGKSGQRQTYIFSPLNAHNAQVAKNFVLSHPRLGNSFKTKS